MTKAWQAAQDEFETYMAAGGKRVFVHRITDSAEVRGMTAGMSGRATGHTKEQPADYVIVSFDTMYYAEVKSSKNPTSFPFKNIERGQWNAATRTDRAGGIYLFFLKNLVTGVWYKVPARVLLDHTAKSIKWSDLQTHIWDRKPCNSPT
jgi:penicillin-binding protein-related factor A (putative recombinase)